MWAKGTVSQKKLLHEKIDNQINELYNLISTVISTSKINLENQSEISTNSLLQISIERIKDGIGSLKSIINQIDILKSIKFKTAEAIMLDEAKEKEQNLNEVTEKSKEIEEILETIKSFENFERNIFLNQFNTFDSMIENSK